MPTAIENCNKSHIECEKRKYNEYLAPRIQLINVYCSKCQKDIWKWNGRVGEPPICNECYATSNSKL